jgi:hypothetical protein
MRSVLLRYPSDFLIPLPMLKDTAKWGVFMHYPKQSV